jgi:hypothetical protein
MLEADELQLAAMRSRADADPKYPYQERTPIPLAPTSIPAGRKSMGFCPGCAADGFAAFKF